MEQVHPKYINPATDFGFKIIFKDEEITREFLNDLLRTRNPKINIASVTIEDGELDETNKSSRRVVYDVHCKTETGEQFVIEMQNDPQEFFSDRIALYMARIASKQQQKGMQEAFDKDGNPVKVPWNYHIKNIYGVFFMNFKDHKRPKALTHCALLDTEDYEVDSDVFQYWKIQLPFYRNIQQSDCKTIIDKWFYILANLSTMKTSVPFTDEKPLFLRLAQIAEYGNLDAKQQRQYDESLDNYLVYFNTLDFREKLGYDKGVETGIKQGLKKGIEQGIEQGEKIGREEGAKQEKISIARNLKSAGIMSMEQIALATGLSEEEVSAL